MAPSASVRLLLLLCTARWVAASPLFPAEGDTFGGLSDDLPPSFIPDITNSTIGPQTINTTDIQIDSSNMQTQHEARSNDDSSSSFWPQQQLGTDSSNADNITLFTLNSASADNSTFYSHSPTNEDTPKSSGDSSSSNGSATNGMRFTTDEDFGIDIKVSPFSKMDDPAPDGSDTKSLDDGVKFAGEETTTSRNTSEASGHNIFQSPPASLPAEIEDDIKEDVSSDGATSEEPVPTKDKVAFGLNGNDGTDGSVTLATSTGGNDHQLTPSREALDAAEDELDNRPSILELHPTSPSGGATTNTPNAIRFRANVESEWRPYVDNLASFLDAYSKEAQERNVHCDFERSVRPGEEACRFDLVYLGPSCTKQNNFGYGIGKPCVLLSPAPVDGWVPAPYENDTTGVPDEIQRLMRIFNANFMFVMCEGETATDRENIGPMAYLPPYQGFPSYFFPNKWGAGVSSSSSFGEAATASAPHYVAPLMAIEFLNPANGTLIGVKCRAWAKNLADVPRKTTLRFSFQVN